MQTKRGGPDHPVEERGDCVPACIASVLGVPLAEIANCHGEGWWERLNAECGKHGYCIAILDMKLWPPDGYWIASLPSLNLGPSAEGKTSYHCVVAKGFELIHDPSIGKRYSNEQWAAAWEAGTVVEGWALMPVDPVELAA